MSQLLIKKQFIDPLEPEFTQHTEIVELVNIKHYSKRTSSPQFEAKYKVHSFNIIGEGVLEKSNLTIWEYFDLLKSKSKEIQEKFSYKVTDEKCVTQYSFEDIAIAIGIGEQYKQNEEEYKEIFWNNTYSPY